MESRLSSYRSVDVDIGDFPSVHSRVTKSKLYLNKSRRELSLLVSHCNKLLVLGEINYDCKGDERNLLEKQIQLV